MPRVLLLVIGRTMVKIHIELNKYTDPTGQETDEETALPVCGVKTSSINVVDVMTFTYQLDDDYSNSCCNRCQNKYDIVNTAIEINKIIQTLIQTADTNEYLFTIDTREKAFNYLFDKDLVELEELLHLFI